MGPSPPVTPARTAFSAPSLIMRLATTRPRLARWGVRAAGWEEAKVRASELGFLPRGRDWFERTDLYKAMIFYALCRSRRPSVAVETGVASGTSSLGFLAALEDNRQGRLFSVDLPEATYDRDRGGTWTDPLAGRPTGWRVPESLRGRWSLRRGPSAELLPSLLAECGPIDLFYHDSEHTAKNMDFEIALAWAALRPGGILAVDNVNWSTSFAQFLARYQPRYEYFYPFLGLAEKPGVVGVESRTAP